MKALIEKNLIYVSEKGIKSRCLAMLKGTVINTNNQKLSQSNNSPTTLNSDYKV